VTPDVITAKETLFAPCKTGLSSPLAILHPDSLYADHVVGRISSLPDLTNRNLIMLHDICLISCYGTADPGIAAFLNGLNRALEVHGIRLLVLTTQPNPDLDALSIDIPYLLSGFDQMLDDKVKTNPLHPLQATLASEEVQTGHAQDREVVRRGMAKCEAFYAALGNTLSPCAAFLWNTTLPHGRIARNTLCATGIPAYCIERGWLPGTFQLHTFENNAYNDFFTDFTLNRSLPDIVQLYGAMPEPFDSAQQFYLAQRIQKYDAGPQLDAQDLRRKYGLGNGKLAVCFCGLAGASAGPHNMPSMAYTSPHFESVSEALAMFSNLMAPYPDVQVLVQEHPIQRIIGNNARIPTRFIATDGENIHTLLNAADHLAFIGSTTVQAEALLVDKPRLSLSRDAASLVGASYGFVEKGPEAVASWMSDKDAKENAFAARAMINYICRERLIRDEKLPDFVRRDINDLADYIAGLSRPSKITVDERLERFIAEANDMLMNSCTD